MERLQKVIAASGYTSRRKAEELIKQGKVKVNGKVVTELGTKVFDRDEIVIDNKIITKETKEYYLINKPRGVITSTDDDKNRKIVTDLIPTEARIYPVGRLDYDTTGALILTNDGDFANILTHPKNKVDKVYLAKLEGIIKGEQINKLKEGIILDHTKVIPSRVKLKKVNNETNTCIVEITIHEGKNHQVKRMFEAVGFRVEKLKRERIGIFTTEGLQSGEFRKLTPKEVAIVYSLKK
ncbi:MAG: rRNA pseudouridine synthase [Bacilli bacterium]|nr:rRNA pseudouridine synthase [Bacilli bacterium]MBR6137680.1 rRNA pseudouridine synthase [Bacilli bacterium]